MWSKISISFSMFLSFVAKRFSLCFDPVLKLLFVSEIDERKMSWM